MAHFLQYWKPERAYRAFDNLTGPVHFLENGWFKLLSPGDVLWLLTRAADGGLRLVLRAEVAYIRERRSHPDYAVGNSREFGNRRASLRDEQGVTPYAIPMAFTELRRLRFHGQSERVRGSLESALQGPLASLRKVDDDSVSVLDEHWKRRRRHPWIEIDLTTGVRSGFATKEHRVKVEKAAVRAVRKQLSDQGWTVRSVEADRCGYDLRCERNRKTLRVEVKGTAGVENRFFITAGELAAAEQFDDYRLYIVANALTNPRIRSIPGNRIAKHFALTPLAFVANPK